jgi:hypothetical protein
VADDDVYVFEGTEAAADVLTSRDISEVPTQREGGGSDQLGFEASDNSSGWESEASVKETHQNVGPRRSTRNRKPVQKLNLVHRAYRKHRRADLSSPESVTFSDLRKLKTQMIELLQQGSSLLDQVHFAISGIRDICAFLIK